MRSRRQRPSAASPAPGGGPPARGGRDPRGLPGRGARRRLPGACGAAQARAGGRRRGRCGRAAGPAARGRARGARPHMRDLLGHGRAAHAGAAHVGLGTLRRVPLLPIGPPARACERFAAGPQAREQLCLHLDRSADLDCQQADPRLAGEPGLLSMSWAAAAASSARRHRAPARRPPARARRRNQPTRGPNPNLTLSRGPGGPHGRGAASAAPAARARGAGRGRPARRRGRLPRPPGRAGPAAGGGAGRRRGRGGARGRVAAPNRGRAARRDRARARGHARAGGRRPAPARRVRGGAHALPARTLGVYVALARRSLGPRVVLGVVRAHTSRYKYQFNEQSKGLHTCLHRDMLQRTARRRAAALMPCAPSVSEPVQACHGTNAETST